MIDSKNIFKEYLKRCIEDGSYNARREFKEMSSDEIAEKEYLLSQNRTLLLGHKIFLDPGHEVTVLDILDNPDKYHEQCCRDPHEPDYGTSTIAKIYSDQEVPVIFSFAHGGLTYHLKPGSLTVVPNFWSTDYWNEHFYLVAHNKKNEILHINGNSIETYSHAGFLSKFNCYKIKVSNDNISDKGISAAKYWLNNRWRVKPVDQIFSEYRPFWK